MEKVLDKCLSDTMNIPGIVGIICADSQGLCLQCKGKVSNHSAGLVTYLAETAAKLEPQSKEKPVIILESDTTNVFIKSVGNVTTAIYKESESHT